ncbi:MAG: GH116 family glycosyl-hydrolase [Armatimonadota bacterium]
MSDTQSGKLPFSREDLYAVGPQRTFSGSALTEIAFPLGGIGAGTISLGGRGNLRDFEIFNKPAKGNMLNYTFFALWAKAPGQAPVARVLEGKVPPPYRAGHGEPRMQLQGLPRFAEATFRGEYPTATVELADPSVPVQATMTAWNPFIPLNVHDSALPAAIFEWTFTNPTDQPVEISLAASFSNPIGVKKEGGGIDYSGGINAYQAVRNLRGIAISNPQIDPASAKSGSLALATTWDSLDVQTRWYRGGWWDPCHLFWDDFREDGRLQPVMDSDPVPAARSGDISSLALQATVPAHGSVTLPVFLSWNFPRMANPWPATSQWPSADTEGNETLQTYTGKHFADAWAVAEYVAVNLDRLRADTGRWRDATFGSTLPDHVLEAITSQASIMRSPTCLLLGDGNFFGWEGCSDTNGCCHGNCTHVWNYEQAVAFLFPELERTMRRTEFLHNTRESGNMAFRTFLPPGAKLSEFKPCADGQMGTIIQVYRDWQLSGDDAFLKEIWPRVKLALEYAWTMTRETMDQESGAGAIGAAGAQKRSIDSLWDPDKDGVMEGEQHNTYDIEFFGPNTMCTAMYLGALRACEEIARHFGETEKAEEYRAIYESGRAKVDAELWNGEYYIQQVKVIDEVEVPEVLKSPPAVTGAAECGATCECKQSPGGKAAALPAGAVIPKYQYGEGCLSDQLLGQWAAHVAGLGYLLDQDKVKTAVKSIFGNNFLPDFSAFENVQRIYALNDEAGLLLCSWPHGNRPTLPFVYSDEVWTGIEFHVAAHLIYEGWIDEGLTIVKAVTERYAGCNRNPWNEVECGHHYARAMSSWSVKLALDGFSYSLPENRLGFAPKINAGNYRTFWSTGAAWGRYTADAAGQKIEVLYGTQTLQRLDLSNLPAPVSVQGPNGPVAARVENGTLLLTEPVTLQAGEALVISS